MRIKINRPLSLVLLVLIYPFAMVSKLISWLRGERKPAYIDTIDGDPLAYNGARPLVIAVWATYASVWKAATAQIMTALQAEFSDRCEFVYIESSSRSVRERYGVEVVPTVIVYRHGHEVARFVNLSKDDELRAKLSELIA